MSETKEELELVVGELLETHPGKLQGILHSRRFWAVVVAISTAIAVELFGFDSAAVERINQVVMVVVGVYIGGLSLEDAARQLKPLLAQLLPRKMV